MNARLLIFAVLLTTALESVAQDSSVDSVLSASNPAPAQLQSLREDVRFLASEELRGRGVEGDTIGLAAEYIAKRMQATGLDTTKMEGSAMQPLSIPIGARPGPAENNRVAIAHRENAFSRLDAQLAKGMNPMTIGSQRGDVTGKLVFVGYGITAPKYDYDDYQDMDVTGAIVIVLRKEPGAADPNNRFQGTKNTRHAFFTTKLGNAIQHGAAAMIIVNDPVSIRERIGSIANEINREEARKKQVSQQLQNLPAAADNIRGSLKKTIAAIDRSIEGFVQETESARRGVLQVGTAGQQSAGKEAIPVISVARDLIDQVFQSSGKNSLVEIEKQINSKTSPESFSLPETKCSIRVELKASIAKTSNVIGVLEGRGPLAQETVVIGAHYDHVGMGGYGSLAPGTIAVHNGADDNASGTAALLATAKQLTLQLANRKSHRRLVFIAFTGEERGLLGSRHYIRNPRYPLKTTVAMVNLDMVGRIRDNELTVYGTGSGDSMNAILEAANQRQQFNLFKITTGYGPSDHQSFYEAGVPVLFFFTGLHNDYHRPSDDFDKIDFGGLTRITDIVSEVTLDLASRAERPKYVQTEKIVQVRRQAPAFMGVTLSQHGDIIVIDAIAQDGPAERGKLRKNDQLVRLGETPIQTPADVIKSLRHRSPGDPLKVLVRRAGKTVDLTIRLGSRPRG